MNRLVVALALFTIAALRHMCVFLRGHTLFRPWESAYRTDDQRRRQASSFLTRYPRRESTPTTQRVS